MSSSVSIPNSHSTRDMNPIVALNRSALHKFTGARIRMQTGSMLLLGIALMTLVCILGAVLLSFTLELYWQQYTQADSEAMALKDAVFLNRNDSAGQINNLTARCRELVYVSRQCYKQSTGHYEYLKPLTEKLVELARKNANRIQEEKNNMIRKTLADLADNHKQIDTGSAESSSSVLDLEVGYLDGQNSGVIASTGVRELYHKDVDAGYILKGTRLFLPFVNLRLPDEDSDLSFTLSAMPGTAQHVLEAHLTQKKFHTLAVLSENGLRIPYRCTELPSAIKVNMCKSFVTPVTGRLKVVAGASGCTNNTLPDL